MKIQNFYSTSKEIIIQKTSKHKLWGYKEKLYNRSYSYETDNKEQIYEILMKIQN